jgi:hypothetical protein
MFLAFDGFGAASLEPADWWNVYQVITGESIEKAVILAD